MKCILLIIMSNSTYKSRDSPNTICTIFISPLQFDNSRNFSLFSHIPNTEWCWVLHFAQRSMWSKFACLIGSPFCKTSPTARHHYIYNTARCEFQGLCAPIHISMQLRLVYFSTARSTFCDISNRNNLDHDVGSGSAYTLLRACKRRTAHTSVLFAFIKQKAAL